MKKGIFVTIAVLGTLGMTFGVELPTISTDDAMAARAPRKGVQNQIRSANQKARNVMNSSGRTLEAATGALTQGASALGALGGMVGAGIGMATQIQGAQLNTANTAAGIAQAGASRSAAAGMPQAGASTSAPGMPQAGASTSAPNLQNTQTNIEAQKLQEANSGATIADEKKVADAQAATAAAQAKTAELEKKLEELQKQKATSANAKPADNKPADNKPADNKPADKKPEVVKKVAYELPANLNIFAGAKFTSAMDEDNVDEEITADQVAAFEAKVNDLVTSDKALQDATNAVNVEEQAFVNDPSALDDYLDSMSALKDAQDNYANALDALSSDPVFQASEEDEGLGGDDADDSSDGMGDDE